MTDAENQYPKLDSETRRAINAEAQQVKPGDLYDALHYVGDDPLKSELEGTLHAYLGAHAFRNVVAVFNFVSKNSSWSNRE